MNLFFTCVLIKNKTNKKLIEIITWGFNETNKWYDFLTKGVYDPRLFIVVSSFFFE
jgi:hypothetical protein